MQSLRIGQLVLSGLSMPIGMVVLLPGLTGPRIGYHLVFGTGVTLGAAVLLWSALRPTMRLGLRTCLVLLVAAVGATALTWFVRSAHGCCMFTWNNLHGYPWPFASRHVLMADLLPPDEAQRYLEQHAVVDVDWVKLFGDLLFWAYLGVLISIPGHVVVRHWRAVPAASNRR